MGKIGVEPLRSKTRADFTMPHWHKAQNDRAFYPSPPSGSTPDPRRCQDSQQLVAYGTCFLTTAPQLEYLPPLDVPEIAFGLPNAGKSTCINTLTQQKRLCICVENTWAHPEHQPVFAG